MRDGYLIAAAVWTIGLAFGVVSPGVDAAQYHAHRLPSPYDVSSYGDTLGGYWYPPVFAQAIYPLTLLPVGILCAVIAAATFAALYVALGRWAWAGLLIPPVWWDLSSGNVNTLIGVAALLSAKHPLFALFPGFTKPTSAVVVLWHAIRGDWFSISRVAVVGLTITGLSFVLSPDLWWQWTATMLANQGYEGPGYFTVPIPLWPRFVASWVLLFWAARTNRTWALPIAAWLALPVLWWTTMAALIAVCKGSRARLAGIARWARRSTKAPEVA